MMMIGAHLSEGTLRALYDGELSSLAALRGRLHLARCSRCRALSATLHEEQHRAQELLSLLDRPVDTVEGWRRFTAVRPDATPSTRRLEPGIAAPRFAWTVAAVLALVVALQAVARDAGPAATAAGQGRQDVCCWDLDGGGPSDDGVMTISRPGELLDCVVLYDDVDRNKSFSDGDDVRYVSRPESCGLPSTMYRPAAGALLALFAVSR